MPTFYTFPEKSRENTHFYSRWLDHTTNDVVSRNDGNRCPPNFAKMCLKDKCTFRETTVAEFVLLFTNEEKKSCPEKNSSQQYTLLTPPYQWVIYGLIA